MEQSPERQTPKTISLLALADRFRETEKTMPNRAFAFVLGAGASRSSGIKGAAQMVEDWVRLLHREVVGDPHGDCKTWATARSLGIRNYDPRDPAASYSELYHRMYHQDPDRGYAYLEGEMHAAEPSYGYSVLARIMDKTRHKVVVTTNFDNLIADSISIFGDTYPLVCGHESLAGFISARVRRPLIVKVHRDLLLAPKSAPQELGTLPDGFSRALTELFKHYTPIVIGYGGNDGSLMEFLRGLPEKSVPGGVFWCYRETDPEPSDEIQQFVAAQQGCLVPIPGFDEAMMLLGNELQYDVPDKYLLEQAEIRAKRIGQQALELNDRLNKRKGRTAPMDAASVAHSSAGVPPDGGREPAKALAELNELAKAFTQTMQRGTGPRRWWQWQERASAAADDAERESIYLEAIAALPDSPELLGNYALFLQEHRKDYDKAETYYLKALEVDPTHANNLRNYAVFLDDARKASDKAEAYYLKALQVDPAHANALGNYALFLGDVRQDYDKAEAYFLKALEVAPTDARALGNYALFLGDVRQDYDKAEAYFLKALEFDPMDAVVLGNYAGFLSSFGKDYDKAESYYLKALEAAPRDAGILGNYAVFLDERRKDYDNAEVYYLKALEVDPADANTLGNYTRLLISTGRTDEGMAMLDRAIAALAGRAPEVVAAEVWMYAVCHWLPERWREALARLKACLLTDKLTTGAWDFSAVIEAAKKRGHPAAEWLEPLASVCAGTADAVSLSEWEAWNAA